MYYMQFKEEYHKEFKDSTPLPTCLRKLEVDNVFIDLDSADGLLVKRAVLCKEKMEEIMNVKESESNRSSINWFDKYPTGIKRTQWCSNF